MGQALSGTRADPEPAADHRRSRCSGFSRASHQGLVGGVGDGPPGAV